MKRRVLSPIGRRRARVGRKAIACGRMISAIESRSATARTSQKKRSFSFRSYQPTRLHAMIAALVVVVTIMSIGGYTVYSRYQADQKSTAEKAWLEKGRIAAKKAADCREKVAAQKTNQIGKATYAELYGASCN